MPDVSAPPPPTRAPAARRPARLPRAAAWAVLLVAALALSAPAAHAASGTILDAAKDQFKNLTALWPFTLSYVARRLFFSLAIIEIVVSAVFWTLQERGLDDIARGLLIKTILLGFVMMLITSSDYWLSPLVMGFVKAGSIVGPVRAPPGPSGILDMGFKYNYMDVSFSQLPLNPFSAALAIIWIFVTQAIILVACAAAAIQLLLLWIEVYVTLGSGVLFLGLGAFRATAAYAENYLNLVFYLGIRLFVFYLMLSLCYQLIVSNNGFALGGTALAPGSTLDVSNLASAAVMAACFGLLVIKVPASIAGRIAGGGGAHFGLANALRSL